MVHTVRSTFDRDVSIDDYRLGKQLLLIHTRLSPYSDDPVTRPLRFTRYFNISMKRRHRIGCVFYRRFSENRQKRYNNDTSVRCDKRYITGQVHTVIEIPSFVEHPRHG